MYKNVKERDNNQVMGVFGGLGELPQGQGGSIVKERDSNRVTGYMGVFSGLVGFLQGQGGFINAQLMQIIGAVILLVVSLVLAPLVLDTVTTLTTHDNIDDFAGAAALAGLIPLVYIASVVGMAGMLIYQSVRRGSGGGGDKAKKGGM